MRGLSLVAASRGHSSSRCAGLSLSWRLLLRSTGSRCTGPVAVAHRPSCTAACGIFPDQGLNPCPLHWQADSQPLHHQGSPQVYVLKERFLILKEKKKEGIPGGPVVRAWHFHCQGPGSIPGPGTKIPQATWPGKKKKHRTSLVAQWLRLCTPNAGGPGSTPS